MTNISDDKRLNDEELEAVAGGMTPLDPMLLNAMGHGFPGLNLNATVADTHAAAAPPTIDPSAVAGLMHSTVSSAVAGGGAYTVDTPTPAHTDSGTTLTISETHTIAPATKFGASSLAGPEVGVSSVPLASGSVTLSGNLSQVIEPPAGSITDQPPSIQVMHIDNTQGNWTRINPDVVADNHAGDAHNSGGGAQAGQASDPQLGGALGRSWGNF